MRKCKGCGFVYACGDQLYVRFKTKRDTLYLSVLYTNVTSLQS